MITFLETDVIDAFDKCEYPKLLLHVVNCQGVMGSGIAKQIKERLPKAYDVYRATYESGQLVLGSYSTASNVVNLAAQYEYGRGVRQLNYGALGHSLSQVHARMDTVAGIVERTNVFVPYLMGCDRAGGDWEIVSEMLDFYFDNVIVCRL